MRGRESDSQDPWGSWVRKQVWTKQEWNQRRSLGRRLSKQLGSEMPWASHGGEGGERWSDKLGDRLDLLKGSSSAAVIKHSKGKLRVTEQSPNSSLSTPSIQTAGTSGPEDCSASPWPPALKLQQQTDTASPVHCPHFTLPVSALVTQ